MRDRATVALTEVPPPQGSVAAAGVVPFATAEAVQTPAVDALVPSTDQHRHAVQPTVRAAEAEQQQPLRHSSVPQSAADAQDSPGELRRQVPVFARHVVQPCRTALGEQQKPPMQAKFAQVTLNTHAAPDGKSVTEGVALTVGATELVPRTEAVKDALPDEVNVGTYLSAQHVSIAPSPQPMFWDPAGCE